MIHIRYKEEMRDLMYVYSMEPNGDESVKHRLLKTKVRIQKNVKPLHVLVFGFGSDPRFFLKTDLKEGVPKQYFLPLVQIFLTLHMLLVLRRKENGNYPLKVDGQKKIFPV